MLSNVTVVAGDRARVGAQLLYCREDRDCYIEVDGIDASGARVAESDIKRRRDRAIGHLLQETDWASWKEAFHFD